MCYQKSLNSSLSQPLLCDYKAVVQNFYQVGEIPGFLALKWYLKSWQIYREIIIWCVAHVASKAKLADILWRLFCCRLIVLPSCLVPHSVMFNLRCIHDDTTVCTAAYHYYFWTSSLWCCICNALFLLHCSTATEGHQRAPPPCSERNNLHLSSINWLLLTKIESSDQLFWLHKMLWKWPLWDTSSPIRLLNVMWQT